MKMIEDAIRGFLWGIVKMILTLSDWVYDMINAFIDVDISSNDVIWYIFTFGLLFLLFACTIRAFFMIVQKMNNDEEPLDFGAVGKRIVQMYLIIVLIPTMFTFSLGIPSTINNTFNSSITFGEPLTPSTSILTSVAKTPLSGDLNTMTANDEIITVDGVGETLNDQQDGAYIYFPGYGELFFCGIMGFLIAFALVNVFMQIVGRWFIQIFRLFVGFVPLSGMIDPKDPSCSQWIRDIFCDVIVQTWSMISLWAVFAIMSLDSITSINGVIRLFMFWIGISSISKLGDMIAKYLQATDLSSPSRLGSAIATMGMYAAGRAGASAVRSGAGFMGNTALSAGAGGIQKIGQSLGGKSLEEMGLPTSRNQRSGNLVSYSDGLNRNAADLSDPLNETPITNGNTPTSQDNSQEKLTKDFIVSSSADDPGRRSNAHSTDQNQDTLHTTLNNSESTSSDNSNRTRLTRENTLARRFVDVADGKRGVSGAMMRGASNVSSHIYAASAVRYSNSALRKAQDILSKPSTVSHIAGNTAAMPTIANEKRDIDE